MIYGAFEILLCVLRQSAPFAQHLSGDEYLDELASVNVALAPRDKWRSQEDRTAVEGNILHIAACAEAGVSGYLLNLRFQGSVLESTRAPAQVVLDDPPSVKGRPSVAATELDRLPVLGKTYECVRQSWS